MTKDEDKKRWKEEAEQLKKDLASRKKIIKKNEVPISFPKKHPLQQKRTTQPKSNVINDSFLRDQINFQ